MHAKHHLDISVKFVKHSLRQAAITSINQEEFNFPIFMIPKLDANASMTPGMLLQNYYFALLATRAISTYLYQHKIFCH
jgi:hypothetical protein